MYKRKTPHTTDAEIKPMLELQSEKSNKTMETKVLVLNLKYSWM